MLLVFYRSDLLLTSWYVIYIKITFFSDIVDNEDLLNWAKEQIKEHENLVVTDVASVFRDGRILCAIISHYRPDLLDYSSLSSDDPAKNNQIAFDILEKEIGTKCEDSSS